MMSDEARDESAEELFSTPSSGDERDTDDENNVSSAGKLAWQNR